MSGLPPPVTVTLTPSQRRWVQPGMAKRVTTPPPEDTDPPATRGVVHAKKNLRVRVSYWEAVEDLAHYYDVTVHEVLHRFIEDGLRRYDNGELELQERAGMKPLRRNPFSKLPTHGPPVSRETPIDREYEEVEEDDRPAPLPPSPYQLTGKMPFMPQSVGLVHAVVPEE